MDKVKNVRYKRTLFVGLGGAGIKTLRRLKEKIKQANGGELPGQVKFLLIDTNATELANFRDFDCNEKVCIAVREPYQRYEYDKKNGDSTHRYIPEKNAHSLKALERGAGQIRSNGHFAVIENQYSNKLIRIFREAADQIEDIDVNGNKLERDPKIEVRMCFSIAGGTGSGTFLPIATLIRSAIRHCELTAYIYSATHFEKFVENSAKKPVMQNAYASLLELDYMMHFGRNGLNYENVKFNFGPHETQHIEQSTRPFEEVYYIDKHTSLPLPESVEFAYNELKRLQENTAEAMHIATTNIITAHTGTVDNVRQKLLEGQFDVGDKFAWVSGFGIAELFLTKLNFNDSRVVDAAFASIDARMKNIDEKDKEKFKRYAYDLVRDNDYGFDSDESKGKDDKDPILTAIVTEEKIVDYIKKIESIPNIHIDAKSIDYELFKVFGMGSNEDLDKLISTLVEKRVCSKLKKLKEEWINNLWKSDSDGKYVVAYNEGEGEILSIPEVKFILDQINDCFGNSITQLKKELDSLKDDCSSAVEDYNSLLLKGKGPEKKGFFANLFGGSKNDGNLMVNSVSVMLPKYKEVVKCILLKYRHEKAIKYFELCQKCISELNKEFTTFENVLGNAKLGKPNHVEESQDGVIIRKENRVEVANISAGYRLSYKDLEELKEEKSYPTHSNKFDYVRRQIVATGELKDYLKDAKKQIRLLPQDRRNKDERTEAQKNLERLIDLSTPTMQIDSHGYGSRVNLDHFWYLMTSFKDNELYNNDDSDLTKVEDEHKSPGQLLKELLEPFLQGEKINCVPVDGWDNKAILYRVDSAVPAYFVDGVCVGELGGNTLEGCYEELKKTRPHYTPFSHEMLRQKLENGLTVLRPHDNTLDEIALEHWVNFQLLSARLNPRFSINFQPCPKYAHRACTTMGYYSIVSDSLGKNLTASLDDRDNILILGKNRTDAYSMFTRYCKTLVDEYPEYREVIDQIQNDDYEEMFVMDGKQYMDIVLPKWTLLKFAEDDPERIQLKKEMDFMDKRKKDFDEKKRKSQKIDNVIDSHKDKPGQPGGGNPDDDNDDK